MKINWKLTLNFFAVLVAVLFLSQSPAFASHGVYDKDGTKIGNATDVTYGYGTQVSMETGRKAKAQLFSGDLLANGRGNGGTTTMQSSSTRIWADNLASAIIQKRVGGLNGVDMSNGGTKLQDGIPGQTLTLQVIQQESGGSWIITPTTKTGFSTVTLNALYESITLQFVNTTVGWIVIGGTGTPTLA